MRPIFIYKTNFGLCVRHDISLLTFEFGSDQSKVQFRQLRPVSSVYACHSLLSSECYPNKPYAIAVVEIENK